MSHEANRERYLELVRAFTGRRLAAPEFVDRFMALWRVDRDEEWADPELAARQRTAFGRLLDRTFTACDAIEDAGELRDAVAADWLAHDAS